MTSESQILYDRDPLTRVRSVAPWLRVDADPYPAVVDGRIVWLVDGYTTTDSYPYSARLRWADATGVNDAERRAFLQGALTHILETDDLHRASVVHPGCVVVPAVWAVAAA